RLIQGGVSALEELPGGPRVNAGEPGGDAVGELLDTELIAVAGGQVLDLAGEAFRLGQDPGEMLRPEVGVGAGDRRDPAGERDGQQAGDRRPGLLLDGGELP